MRFLGLIITLAIIGYAIHVYLGASTGGGAGSEPEQRLDQAGEAADLMNQALQRHQDSLDRSR